MENDSRNPRVSVQLPLDVITTCIYFRAAMLRKFNQKSCSRSHATRKCLRVCAYGYGANRATRRSHSHLLAVEAENSRDPAEWTFPREKLETVRGHRAEKPRHRCMYAEKGEG